MCHLLLIQAIISIVLNELNQVYLVNMMVVFASVGKAGWFVVNKLGLQKEKKSRILWQLKGSENLI